MSEKAGVSNPWTLPVFSQQPSIKPLIRPILDHWYSEVGIWEDLRASGDHLGTGLGRSILRSFWVNSEAILDPF